MFTVIQFLNVYSQKFEEQKNALSKEHQNYGISLAASLV